MKTKKGVEGHVDWVISIGIFLTYLLGMFVLIKPGVIPVHDYNTLLDIVEENAKKDYDSGLYWTLYKVPLFITTAPGGNCIKIEDFPYSVSPENLNVYKIVKENNIESLSSLEMSLQENTLYIKVKGVSFIETEKYFIYFSDNKAYTNNGKPKSETIETNFDLGGCVIIGDTTNPFEYNLGIPEKTRGLVDDPLGSEDYNEIKKRYGYPLSKDFSIVITKGGDVDEYKTSEPDAKTNVYTRQWSDFMLKYDGTRDPVQISIKVW